MKKRLFLIAALGLWILFAHSQTKAITGHGVKQPSVLSRLTDAPIDSVHGWVGYYHTWQPSDFGENNHKFNSARDSALDMVYEPAIAVYKKDTVYFTIELVGIFIYHDIYESEEEAERRGHLVQKRMRTVLDPFNTSKYYIFIPDADVFRYREIR